MNLEDYYTQYAKPLHGYAKLLTYDPDQAADLVQETLEKAIEYPYNPSKGKGVYGYLIMVMRSVFLQQQERDVLHTSTFDCELEDVVATASHNPWPGVIRSIDLRERLEVMPPLRQKIAVLFIQGYTIDEILESIRIPRSTIHWHLEKIRVELGL